MRWSPSASSARAPAAVRTESPGASASPLFASRHTGGVPRPTSTRPETRTSVGSAAATPAASSRETTRSAGIRMGGLLLRSSAIELEAQVRADDLAVVVVDAGVRAVARVAHAQLDLEALRERPAQAHARVDDGVAAPDAPQGRVARGHVGRELHRVLLVEALVPEEQARLEPQTEPDGQRERRVGG